MNNSRKDISLLEHLAERMQCRYLSDLRNREDRARLSALVRGLPARKYPAAEWLDALNYLTGERADERLCAEEVKSMLTERLKREERAESAAGMRPGGGG